MISVLAFATTLALGPTVSSPAPALGPQMRATEPTYIQAVLNPQGPNPIVWRIPEADGQVQVRRGETLLVIYPDRRRVRIEGPYAGPLSAARSRQVLEASFLGRLAAMFDRSRMRYDAIGGVRGDGAPPPPPVPVLRSLDALPPINVEARGPQCVAASGSAILWRANADRRQTFTLAVLGGSAATVAFAADAQEAPWPGRLLPEATTTDVVVAEAGSGFRTTSFRFVAVPTTTGPAILSALIYAGCLQQAEAVAAYLDQSPGQ